MPTRPRPSRVTAFLLLLTAWAGVLGARVALADAGGPLVLTNQHVDIQVRWTGEPGEPLVVEYRDADTATVIASTNALVRIPESARLELPDGFPELGPAGSHLWILPQSQDPGLLYLGFRSAVPGGALAAPVRLALRAVRGPGQVVLWQAGPSGLDVRWSSRDGLDASDSIALSSGSHGHYNIGFSTNGIHEVVLQALGTPPGGGADLVSAETAFRFEVLPLPDIPVAPARLAIRSGPVAGRQTLLLTGTPGARYRIEGGAVLGVWESLGDVVAAEGETPAEVGVPGGAGAGFYRAVSP